MPTPSMADAPFHAPPGDWIELELPLPPSVNRFVTKLGNSSPVVRKWRALADMSYLLQKPKLRGKSIAGKYELHIIWNEQAGDWDNRIKPLSDYLERVCLVENDRLCRRAVVEFGDIPAGCRVRIRAWGQA